ncbi:MAG: DUF1385 domain-containing protein [Deltaproteobacteria bacterium]|nr:DUF1385 domain-containing protein [Deltaproteobacteria bacterium]
MTAEPKELVLGGQAVIEGVMMKGRSTFAVAVRTAGGEIRVRDFPIAEGPVRARLSRVPFVRGVVTMAAMLVIGYRALQFSADEAMADAEKPGTAGDAAGGKGAKGKMGTLAMTGTLFLALAAGIGLFFLVPLFLARGLAAFWPAVAGPIAFNLADGVIRVLIFVGYILAIGLSKDIRRVFQYHGAEHKVVHAYEREADLSPESVKRFPNLHPRCGTSFLLFVMVISILVFSLIPHGSSLAAKALMRLLLLPVIAGISYEALRLSARKAGSPLFRALVAPGLVLQKLTTREPDVAQIEVAIASFRRVAPGGEGVPRVG